MSPLGWLFLGLLALLAFVLAVACWRQDLEIQRLTVARHARSRERAAADSAVPDAAAPADQRPAGSAPAHPRFGALLDTPPEGISAVRPDGTVPVRLPLADRVIERKQVPGRPPWTGSQPVLTEDEVIERDRQQVIRAELEALGDDPTESGVGRVLAMARALPAPTTAGPELARRVIA